MTDPETTIREERRFVTALFADLVGSTALGERLEPEELKLVVGDAVGRIVGAVEAFGGTIKDLAGDGVLALFGAPVAHEDDPERALLAGLRIVDEMGEFARRGPPELGHRGLRRPGRPGVRPRGRGGGRRGFAAWSTARWATR